MNALEIKDYLLNNENKLIELLEHIGLASLHKRGNELRCAIEEGANPTSIRIKLNENLSYSNYADGLGGDIYSLVGWKIGNTKNDFVKNFKYVCNFLNINGTFKKNEKPKIFGGIFTEIQKHKYNPLSNEIVTYPMELLNSYEESPNQLFLKDGISLETQVKFKIGYDWYTHRITIPEFNCEGELIGVTGRWNGYDYEDYGVPKYFPIIEFEKSKVLFGYSQNYEHLLNNHIWLFESQKSVMRMDSLGIYNCLALGGRFISPIQLRYIQSLNPKSIILALDEGIEEEEFIKTCNELISQNIFNKYKVGYLFDRDNTYLKKGSKDSPADLKIGQLKKFSKKVKWIN
ncbi:hypothetical protein [Clostridium sardiniense]|uniref:hypothetical protein n=1 Tax=Clostridium sardiniense TaxID=29369 RepID=UPI00195EC0FD|nr:hypothetical protein [Clostridium sardiniense]MBM7836480.1 DNA primase [Clostridium sardiniense]